VQKFLQKRLDRTEEGEKYYSALKYIDKKQNNKLQNQQLVLQSTSSNGELASCSMAVVFMHAA